MSFPDLISATRMISDNLITNNAMEISGLSFDLKQCFVSRSKYSSMYFEVCFACVSSGRDSDMGKRNLTLLIR